MKVHEYQAKDLLKASGVAVPDGIVATTPEEAAEAFDKLGGGLIVVKAQVHAGGRGKGIAIGPDDDRGEALEIASGLKPRKDGMAKGVQLVRSKEDAKRAAAELLGKTLVTYHELYPTTAALEDALAGSAEGLPEQFAQLDELLAGRS